MQVGICATGAVRKPSKDSMSAEESGRDGFDTGARRDGSILVPIYRVGGKEQTHGTKRSAVATPAIAVGRLFCPSGVENGAGRDGTMGNFQAGNNKSRTLVAALARDDSIELGTAE